MEDSVYTLLDALDSETAATAANAAYHDDSIDPRSFHPPGWRQQQQQHQSRQTVDEWAAVEQEVDGYEDHAYPAPPQRYQHQQQYPFEAEGYGDDYGVVEENGGLDEFDRQLLRMPEEDRQQRALEGRARLTLGPVGRGVGMQDQLVPPHVLQARPITDLSQFAYNGPLAQPSSSSPGALSSSPAFNASQRRSQGQPPSVGRRQLKHPLEAERQMERLGETPSPTLASQLATYRPSYARPQPEHKRICLGHAPPMDQGIELVPTTALPDRLRSIFLFPLFNAIQSKCFATVYQSNDNFVLSSPTGSGKTAVLELAICRAINGFASGQYKIVYQAPTKSLCSERYRDWEKKFGVFDIHCAELTGDTGHVELKSVQSATIIITTPEKWDSVTRKWKDHEKLMRMVKLLLIDEVHILKEDRGATLEAVVSRMKSVGSNVRFIALSATVPNFEDIATWLGRDSSIQHVPASCQRFGEEFRPVKLQKHVVGYSCGGNDFSFDKLLDSKLPEVIAKYSHRKPIMIFCPTRQIASNTAKNLANWWATKGPRDRYWEAPRREVPVTDSDLRNCVSSAVAFHHAGVPLGDRTAIEKAYLEGNVNVICCTSTLAVGVNLPCHMVIIKNTVTYQAVGLTEYADLEIMQMLGRAGRPQFDDSAVAVILTKQQKAQHYEKMVSGQEILESCLHRNLIDHLNAEVGLGTITSYESAKRWLKGTFLYVRLQQNPDYYRLEEDTAGSNLDARLEQICRNGIEELQKYQLLANEGRLTCTEFGDAMARYYVQFETMKQFMAFPERPKLSEILTALAQASEFKEIRFRAGEKAVYKTLNSNASIKFPIPVDLALPAHKVSIIIQSVLGGVDFPADEKAYKHRTQYNMDQNVIFRHVSRFIRCIIDCQLFKEDAVGSRNALCLERSLGAKAWDDSPLQMRQIESIGIVAVRKLANANITTLEDLENTEPHRIEMVLGKNPPYGMKILDKLKSFPRPRVSLHVMGYAPSKGSDGVRVNLKAEMGMMNDKPPTVFNKKPVYVCLLAETTDGRKVHFARSSVQKLGKGLDVLFSALLTHVSQGITCYVMCAEIAGTQRWVTIKPNIPAHLFPKRQPGSALAPISTNPVSTHGPNTSRRRVSCENAPGNPSSTSDEFGDDDLNDSDLLQAASGPKDLDFDHIDSFYPPSDGPTADTRRNTARNASMSNDTSTELMEPPEKLPNGRYACKHSCGDKTICRHLCCREGLAKPPKGTKKPVPPGKNMSTQTEKTQSKLGLHNTKLTRMFQSPHVERIDLTTKEDNLRTSEKFHKGSASEGKTPRNVPAITKKQPSYSYARGDEPTLSFLQSPVKDDGDVLRSNHFKDAAGSGSDPPRLMSEDDWLRPPELDDEFDNTDSALDTAMADLAETEDRMQAKEDTALEGGGTAPPTGKIDPTGDGFGSGDTGSTTSMLFHQPSRKENPLFVTDTSSTVPGHGETVMNMEPGDEKDEKDAAFQLPVTTREYGQDVEDEEERVRKFEEETRKSEESKPVTATTAQEAVVVPPGYEEVDPWLLAEFGDCVEFN